MATYYLNADTGANGNPGTSASPWETFVYAESQMSNGDTVIAQDSTATYLLENVTINVSITLTGASVAGVVFDGAAGGPTWTLQADFTVSNVTFQNVGAANILFYINTAGSSGWDLTVNACILTDIGAGSWPICYIQAGTDMTATFQACIFYNCAIGANQALFRMGGNQTGQTTSFLNCTFYFDGTDIGGANPAIFQAPIADTVAVIITNTVFRDSAASGIHVVAFGGITSKTYDYNCANAGWLWIPAGTGNITGDPLFVDEANANFNLRPTSPCIDTGTLI